jgi:hypothetical protein
MIKIDNTPAYNLYCDESCHLLNDHIPIMGFGMIITPLIETRKHSLQIKEIKQRHNCTGELKWIKVSAKNINFYLEIVHYFFSTKEIAFKSLIVHNKGGIDSESFIKDGHDLFYYKMYYDLIETFSLYNPDKPCKIYLDEKDTLGCMKIHRLKEDLLKSIPNNAGQIEDIQEIKSKQSNMVQLADFFLGAVTYANRELFTNSAKLTVIKEIETRSGYSLKHSTEPWEAKFNLLHFYPRETSPRE